MVRCIARKGMVMGMGICVKVDVWESFIGRFGCWTTIGLGWGEENGCTGLIERYTWVLGVDLGCLRCSGGFDSQAARARSRLAQTACRLRSEGLSFIPRLSLANSAAAFIISVC